MRATAGSALQLVALARSMAADSWAAEVGTAMREAAVPALLLKGPVIVRWLYDPAEERGYGDVDLLVSPRTLVLAERVLVDLGFRLKDAGADEMASGPHAATWVRPDDRAIVDLHHTLPGDVPVQDAVWPVLYDRATTMEVAGTEVDVIDPPSRALLVALHALHHGLESPGPLEDLRRAIARVSEDVWEQAVLIAAQTVTLERLGAGLALLPEGAALADRLRARTAPALRELDRDAVRKAAAAYREAPSSRERAALAWDVTFPAPEFIRWRSPRARRSRTALRLAYATRAVGVVVRLARAARAA